MYVFQNQIMHQILYAFVFYIRVCERYFLATMTMVFQFLVCKHVAYVAIEHIYSVYDRARLLLFNLLFHSFELSRYRSDFGSVIALCSQKRPV